MIITKLLPKVSTSSPSSWWHGSLHLATRLLGGLRRSQEAGTDCGSEEMNNAGEEHQSCAAVSQSEDLDMAMDEGALFPGLPDDLVLECVLTKLSWQQLLTCSSVSRGWRSIIQSRASYDARIRTGSAQRLVTVLHKVRGLKTVSTALQCSPEDEDPSPPGYFFDHEGHPDLSASLDLLSYSLDDDDDRSPTPEAFAYALSLHNPRDGSWQQLPSIPSVRCGIPLFSELACIQGKLFVLGGRDQETWQPRREVYMLDLVAGNGAWQQRASMLTARASFGCGVIGDKIFVAGGHSDASCALANAEAYDLERNLWVPISDMHGARSCCTVAIWEKNMYVIGGYTMSGETEEERARYAQQIEDSDNEEDGEWADSAEVWDAVKGEWLELGNMKKFNDYDEQACTVFKGDLYSFSTLAVEKLDPVSKVWTQMYKDSWSIPYGDGSTPCLVLSVAAVDDEVFAMVCVGDECDRGCTLLRSRGFGKPGARLCWERAICPVKFVCAFPALIAVEV